MVRMARGRRSRDDRGMTLVEVMIAVLILGVVAVGAVAFFLKGRVAVENSACRRVAVQIAKERLERSRSAGYAVLTSGTSTVALDGTTYSWELKVRDALADPSDNDSVCKVLDVTVDWPGSQGNPVFVRTAISE